jgi:hypothetical protein
VLEDSTNQPGYKRELRGFQAPAIRVSNDALVIDVDFTLVVK